MPPLAGHDLQHLQISLGHTITPEVSEVADAAVYILLDDTFVGGDCMPLHS